MKDLAGSIIFGTALMGTVLTFHDGDIQKATLCSIWCLIGALMIYAQPKTGVRK